MRNTEDLRKFLDKAHSAYHAVAELEAQLDPTEPETTEAPTETPKKGCGSSVALGLVALVALMGTALLGKKER